MLIKLAGGAKAEISGLSIQLGALFFRYLYSGIYDKGEVIEIRAQEVIVDFLDTVRSFPASEVTLVCGYTGEEHLMFCGEGTMVKDYRGKRKDSSEVESLEDLLDFDKWMV